jgi:signal transduction histidine kinase
MLALRRALLALFALGVVFAGLDVAITLVSRHEPHKLETALFGVVIGLSFIGVGISAWWRRPLNRFGLLMTLVGYAWFLGGLAESNSAGLFTVGAYLAPLYIVVGIHMVLTFPTGRLETTAQRALVAAGYLAVLFVRLPFFVLGGDIASGLDGPRPGNSFALADARDLAGVFDVVASFVGIVCLVGAVVLVLRKLRDATGPQRRQQAPMVVTSLVLIAFLVISLLLEAFGAQSVSDAAAVAALVSFAVLPYSFLLGLLRSRYSRAGAVGELIERLNDPDRKVELRDALAEALGDPTLQLLFWRPSAGQYVTAEGRPVELPERGSGRAVAEVRAPRGARDGAGGADAEGALVGAVVHDEQLVDEPELVRMVAGSAGLALDNERLQAELRARVEELQQSRARLLEISTFERRRLERDLHDGAQQRLVALSLQLGLAERKLKEDQEVAGRLLVAAREELQTALAELRELARGIHPAILTDRGLGPAVQALAERAPLPVDIAVMPEERMPAPVEAAAYFVVAESLTNIAKYAQANHATVSVAQDDGFAVVEVRDDGVGGANPAAGTGLRGLADRLAALDGRLEVHSPAGQGTLVRAKVPCA